MPSNPLASAALAVVLLVGGCAPGPSSAAGPFASPGTRPFVREPAPASGASPPVFLVPWWVVEERGRTCAAIGSWRVCARGDRVVAADHQPTRQLELLARHPRGVLFHDRASGTLVRSDDFVGPLESVDTVPGFWMPPDPLAPLIGAQGDGFGWDGEVLFRLPLPGRLIELGRRAGSPLGEREALVEPGVVYVSHDDHSWRLVGRMPRERLGESRLPPAALVRRLEDTLQRWADEVGARLNLPPLPGPYDSPSALPAMPRLPGAARAIDWTRVPLDPYPRQGKRVHSVGHRAFLTSVDEGVGAERVIRWTGVDARTGQSFTGSVAGPTGATWCVRSLAGAERWLLTIEESDGPSWLVVRGDDGTVQRFETPLECGSTAVALTVPIGEGQGVLLVQERRRHLIQLDESGRVLGDRPFFGPEEGGDEHLVDLAGRATHVAVRMAGAVAHGVNGHDREVDWPRRAVEPCRTVDPDAPRVASLLGAPVVLPGDDDHWGWHMSTVWWLEWHGDRLCSIAAGGAIPAASEVRWLVGSPQGLRLTLLGAIPTVPAGVLPVASERVLAERVDGAWVIEASDGAALVLPADWPETPASRRPAPTRPVGDLTEPEVEPVLVEREDPRWVELTASLPEWVEGPLELRCADLCVLGHFRGLLTSGLDRAAVVLRRRGDRWVAVGPPLTLGTPFGALAAAPSPPRMAIAQSLGGEVALRILVLRSGAWALDGPPLPFDGSDEPAVIFDGDRVIAVGRDDDTWWLALRDADGWRRAAL